MVDGVISWRYKMEVSSCTLALGISNNNTFKQEHVLILWTFNLPRRWGLNCTGHQVMPISFIDYIFLAPM